MAEVENRTRKRRRRRVEKTGRYCQESQSLGSEELSGSVHEAGKWRESNKSEQLENSVERKAGQCRTGNSKGRLRMALNWKKKRVTHAAGKRKKTDRTGYPTWSQKQPKMDSLGGDRYALEGGKKGRARMRNSRNAGRGKEQTTTRREEWGPCEARGGSSADRGVRQGLVTRRKSSSEILQGSRPSMRGELVLLGGVSGGEEAKAYLKRSMP